MQAANPVTLDDKYTRTEGRIFITGTQALVRLPMTQQQRDGKRGHSTAGYISGYRGSPLGNFDDQIGKARKHLDQHNVVFVPGVNEDLAATAVWGTQQAEIGGEGRYDGVFALWYGKGPGVDRTGDAFRHGNLAGSSKLGGVLVLMGDDHTCESSTTCHQSEFAMVDAMIPVLSPAGVQEILDYGVLGWALSRYSGCWVGIKCVKDTVEATASIDVDVDRVQIVIPEGVDLPADGLNIRQPDSPHAQEARLHRYKLGAVKAFARSNRIDRVVIDGPAARLGVVTHGKSYLDVLQALDDLNLSDEAAAALGLRLYKVGMPWPLEPQGASDFAHGLDKILVVEEKRSLLEFQLKENLYGRRDAPAIVGKVDEEGRTLFQSEMALDSNQIAIALGERLLSLNPGNEALALRLEELRAYRAPKGVIDILARGFYFCSGCPHSSSTVVPEGSKAYAGIGCHWMVQSMDRSTIGYTQMGAEGMSWVGEAPFSRRRHVFQNIGDGTYFHSGSLAIRQSIAAKVNITYKILYNDAVAMTGGQPVDGTLTVPDIAHQVRSEGVQTIVVLSDDIEKWADHSIFPRGVEFYDRAELDVQQKRLREVPGTSVLIFDQTCAAEKRRRRKRGKMPDPAKRTAINSLVCEGCGDCGVKSNCVSVLPKETEFGRKREIDQSNCNKDFSCVKGFCPSFVTIKGGGPRKRKGTGNKELLANLPEPQIRSDLEQPWNILITGVGGTGVVTIGALLGMAAHLEHKGASVLDQTGLAQKGGAVTTHVRIARSPADIHAVRIAAGEADLVLGCDMVVVNDYWALSKIRADRTEVVINDYQAMPGPFTRQPDMQFPAAGIVEAIRTALGGREPVQVAATEIATTLMGDAIATNLFMLGVAWQRGLVPISYEALVRAIELNGAAIEMNKTAFAWGRLAAINPQAVLEAAGLVEAPQTETIALPLDDERLSRNLDETIERRVKFLTDYQDTAYAGRYVALVDKVRQAEARKAPGSTALTEAVARYYFKLMAYKDEYEVARLYTSGEFKRRIEQQFDGDYKIHFNLAPPLFAKRDADGHLVKKEYGPWMFTAFGFLAKLKFLRGGVFDIFGRTDERRMERRLIVDYAKTVEELLAALDGGNVDLAAQIASVPEHIRGYGHVKEAHFAKAKAREAELLAAWRSPKAAAVAA